MNSKRFLRWIIAISLLIGGYSTVDSGFRHGVSYGVAMIILACMLMYEDRFLHIEQKLRSIGEKPKD